MQNDIYHETLGSAFEAVREYLKNERAISTEFDNYLHTGGISRNQTWQGHFKLDSLQGHETRSYLHISIYRFETGRYELTRYLG